MENLHKRLLLGRLSEMGVTFFDMVRFSEYTSGVKLPGEIILRDMRKFAH